MAFVKPSRYGVLDVESGLLHCGGFVRLGEVSAVSGRSQKTVERYFQTIGVTPIKAPNQRGYGRSVPLDVARQYVTEFSRPEEER